MKDVTPRHLRCRPAGCPAVFEVTPQDMRCGGSFSSCPAIFEREDGYLIIGKDVCATGAWAGIPDEIKDRIGYEEILIWVPKGLVVPAPGAEDVLQNT